MRHQRIIGAVTSLQGKRHSRHETKHGALDFGIRQTNRDQKCAGCNPQRVHPSFLAPHARAMINDVGNDPAEGPECDVEQAKHGSPSPRAGLPERREVLQIIGPEDGVDRELTAKGAEIGASVHQGLQGSDHLESFVEAGFHHHFAPRRVKHLLLRDLGFLVTTAGGKFSAVRVLQIFVGTVRGTRRALFIGESAGDGNDVAG